MHPKGVDERNQNAPARIKVSAVKKARGLQPEQRAANADERTRRVWMKEIKTRRRG